ncbi:MAG: S8 family serine peptidase, partial [Candidatus Krumholzibacteria bacterium]|nr:S8 family serine peptidase [Candidatus Krumholzibacteria bacterium]
MTVSTRSGQAVSDLYNLERGEDTINLKCGRHLLSLLGFLSPDETVTIWIFFSDHGAAARRIDGSTSETWSISPRACARMRLRTSLDYDLLCVCTAYIDSLRPHVKRFRRTSKYFNAVSAEVEARSVAAICSYPFVKKVDKVAVYRRRRDSDVTCPVDVTCRSRTVEPVFDKYGESLDQLKQIQMLELLEAGYNGSGMKTGVRPVLICILDTGFNCDHEALQSVNVLAEWDFVQNDSVTSNEAGDHPLQDMHGTTVLGTIAGYHEGDLIGPAWGADYILAKTEIYDDEIKIEEDNWVAGIEWADSIGADIVSSSLGYIEWYAPDSMDGDTPLCTRMADRAVSRGMVVVNAVGNGYPGYGVIAPADGDSVIAVGAVDRYGNIAHFSSRGPTADHRIKPELVAMGVGVHSVGYPTTTGYGSCYGTSYATPLVAGVCALLLEIHPEWSPIEVRQALLFTSTRSGSPDNTYGYGVPRALMASGFDGESLIFT